MAKSALSSLTKNGRKDGREGMLNVVRFHEKTDHHVSADQNDELDHVLMFLLLFGLEKTVTHSLPVAMSRHPTHPAHGS